MANNTDLGFVYIFTNKSFRDGWIKIGKTKDVNKRLNDLDNTSCPLPFDVYATLKTSRYEDAEIFVHEYISHFNRDLRIRPNREYFKVSKEEALEVLYQVKRMMVATCNKVIFLKRISFGGLALEHLSIEDGEGRLLNSEETDILLAKGIK